MRVIAFSSLGLFALMLCLSACKPHEHTAKPNSAPPSSSVHRPDGQDLAKVKRLPAEDIERTGAKPFCVAMRTPELKHFACSQCHKELPQRTAGAPLTLNHTAMSLRHASSSTMQCRSCHNEKEADTLRLLDGTPVSFDAAYRVCAQCHFQQHRDWANGAHGKRLYQWQGERVVLSCTGCHNPHDPLFAKRHPVGQPTIPSTRPGSATLPAELPGQTHQHGEH